MYIILVDMIDSNNTVCIISDDEGIPIVFSSFRTAQDTADEQILCQNFPYMILNIDEKSFWVK